MLLLNFAVELLISADFQPKYVTSAAVNLPVVTSGVLPATQDNFVCIVPVVLSCIA